MVNWEKRRSNIDIGSPRAFPQTNPHTNGVDDDVDGAKMTMTLWTMLMLMTTTTMAMMAMMPVLLHHNANKLFAVRQHVNFLSSTIEIYSKSARYFKALVVVALHCIQRNRDKCGVNHGECMIYWLQLGSLCLWSICPSCRLEIWCVTCIKDEVTTLPNQETKADRDPQSIFRPWTLRSVRGKVARPVNTGL